MASLLFYLSATVLLAQSTVAFNCSKAPIYVDIHKRAVHDSSTFQYGSFIGVGTPAQNHSLWPSLSQNHTSFAALDYCGDNSTLKDCSTSTGGFFSNKDSTTFTQNAKDFQSLDKARNNTFTGFFGQDVLRLYTHYFETDGASQTLVPDSTVEVAEEGSTRPGIVGIGGSSTLLRDLAGRDMIAGKTYSLYIGQGYDRAGGAVNGSNVFGGYDSGRFKGPVHKYAMNLNRANPMSLRVKDIVISGTDDKLNVSLFDPSVFKDLKSRPEPFEAEITTDQFPLSLPYQITKNFIDHLQAEKDNTWGDNSLKLKQSFNGTLSIVLEDGYTVTLPSEILSNKSNITPIQDRDEDSNAPFYLSAAFLTQVYLMADFDTNNFYLADAVQKNNMVMPVTFCPKTVPEPYSPPNQSSWVKQGLIGAVVGGVFGTLGVGVCLYCFYLALLRRRQERKLKKDLENMRRTKMLEQMEVEDKAPEFDPPPKSATPFFWKKR